jgi:hypothetical protein
VTAALSSVVLAFGVRLVVDTFGGFTIGATNRAARFHQMWANLTHVPLKLAELVGIVNTSQDTGGVPLILTAAHVVIAPLLLFCFVAAVVRLIDGVRRGDAREDPGTHAAGGPEPWRLDDLLVLGTLGCVFNFVYLSQTSSGFLRYLTAAVVFMSILAGREVTRWWAKPHAVEARRRAKALAAVALSCFLVTCGLEVSSSVDDPPIAGLVSFLETHHLYSGVGDFWAASLTTVWSNGKVSVRPLVPASNEVLEGFNRGEAPGWFRGQRFQFVVYPASNGANSNFSVSLLTATMTWGAPTQTYLVSGYEVLLWSHSIEVSHYEPLMQPFS